VNLPDTFDRSLFDESELEDLIAFAGRCIEARTPAAIESAGRELDERRAAHRAYMKRLGQRSKSLNFLYKQLIKEVPRRFDLAIVEEETAE